MIRNNVLYYNTYDLFLNNIHIRMKYIHHLQLHNIYNHHLLNLICIFHLLNQNNNYQYKQNKFLNLYFHNNNFFPECNNHNNQKDNIHLYIFYIYNILLLLHNILYHNKFLLHQNKSHHHIHHMFFHLKILDNVQKLLLALNIFVVFYLNNIHKCIFYKPRK